MGEPWMIYFGAFSAVFLAVQFAYQFLARDVGTRRKVNQRLQQIERGDYNPYDIEVRRQGPLDGTFVGPLRMIERPFRQAGGQAALVPLAAFAMVPPLVVMTGAIVKGASPGTALLLALILGIVGGLGGLFWLRARRIKRFAEQFPDVLDVIVRSLSAGHPLPVSLSLVAREMPDPAGTEIGLATDEIAFGRDITSALENMNERIGYDELRFFVTAVAIQQQTGGNLGEILSRLSVMMRERFRMKRKVRSLSSEGRMSAIVLSVFPFLLFFVIQLISPAYYGDVWNNPVFEVTLYACAVLMIVGNVILYRMVNFKV